jgi:hypothetical protein
MAKSFTLVLQNNPLLTVINARINAAFAVATH